MTALLLLSLGCLEPLEESTDAAPGSIAWDDEDISCAGDNDCNSGESCLEGICQLQRCAGDLSASSPPLGEAYVFFQENEIAVADEYAYEGSYWIDGYESSSNDPYEGSYAVSNKSLTDIAGGDFFGTRPETYAAIVGQNKELIFVKSDGSTRTQSLDFTPLAVAAGDADGDGQDEAVVVGDTDLWICNGAGGCDEYAFDGGVDIIDVGVGDIDGDFIEEPVLLMSGSGYTYLYGANLDWEETGQVQDYVGTVDESHIRIDVADVNGDGYADAMTLVDSGYWDWLGYDDEIHTFASAEDGKDGYFSTLSEDYVTGYEDVIDLAAGDTDLDEVAEVFAIDQEYNHLIGLGWSGGGLAKRSNSAFDVTSSAHRIAMADVDGDAPRARLQDGPEECTGDIVPIMAMMFPPYDGDHSSGFCYAFYGDGESTTETLSDSVSLGVGMEFGVGGEFAGFGASVTSKLGYKASASVANSESINVGSRYSIRAEPDLYGSKYGAVVVSSGCWDGYTYELDDPAGYVGGDGETFAVTVPTGGDVTLMSTARYNALAQALGTIPVIDVPYTVGDVSTYPTEMEKIDGTELKKSELLFPDSPTYPVSDVGYVGWWNSVSESTTNSYDETYSLGVSANVTVSGIKVGASTEFGVGSGYSLRVGQSAEWGGGIPAVPDNPDTPEDEFDAYRYSVTPLVYLQEYEVDDQNLAFWVQTYAVQ